MIHLNFIFVLFLDSQESALKLIVTGIKSSECVSPVNMEDTSDKTYATLINLVYIMWNNIFTYLNVKLTFYALLFNKILNRLIKNRNKCVLCAHSINFLYLVNLKLSLFNLAYV